MKTPHLLAWLFILLAISFKVLHGTQGRSIEAGLLIVGGTESGCAAAVQAARMGVGKIVLVNDITWLGGAVQCRGAWCH